MMRKLMTHIYKKQRGAMFGLDARITLAILAALTITGGYYMNVTALDARARTLIKEIEEFRTAIINLQNDIQVNLHYPSTGSSNTAAQAFSLLYSPARLPTNLQSRWQGPYLNISSNKHPVYGNMSLVQSVAGTTGYSSTCPAGVLRGSPRTCTLDFVIEDVPLNIINKIEELVDLENQEGVKTGRPQSYDTVSYTQSGQVYTMQYRLYVVPFPYFN